MVLGHNSEATDSLSTSNNILPLPPLTPSPPSAPISLSNPLTQIHHFLSIKLNPKNFLVWRTQILPLIQGLRLIDYIDGSSPSPPAFTTDPTTSTSLPNPDFASWEQQDQLLMSAIINSLSEEDIRPVVSATTSHEIWTTLERSFASPSNSRIMHLRLQLQNLKQGDLSVQAFLQQAKGISDELAAAGQPLSPIDFNLHVFKGLRPEFRADISTLSSRPELVTYSELLSFLLTQEFLRNDSTPHNTPATPVNPTPTRPFRPTHH